MAVNVGHASHEGDGDCIAQQIARHYPGGMVQLRDANLQVYHHLRQHSHDHRLVQGSEDNAQGHQTHHYPTGAGHFVGL